MFKVLILPIIGVVAILLLRTHKEDKAIPVFTYNEETSLKGDSSVYIRNSWEGESVDSID